MVRSMKRQIPWWLNSIGARHWSKEEHLAWVATHSAAIVIFIPFFVVNYRLLQGFGIEKHIAAIIGGAWCPVASYYASYKICDLLWRNLMKTACDNATKRLEKSQ